MDEVELDEVELDEVDEVDGTFSLASRVTIFGIPSRPNLDRRTSSVILDGAADMCGRRGKA
jgi:hypothetical protein